MQTLVNASGVFPFLANEHDMLSLYVPFTVKKLNVPHVKNSILYLLIVLTSLCPLHMLIKQNRE